MSKQKSLSELSSVRAINVFLKVIWIVGIIGTLVFVVLMPIGYWGSHPKDSKFALVNGVIHLAGLLTLGIILWIVYHLHKLMRTVLKGNPFDILNPRHIRKIAYGVFAWIPIELSSSRIILRGLYDGSFSPLNLLNLNWRFIVMLSLLGAGILVIAKIFEVGAKLQQEQNLTI